MLGFRELAAQRLGTTPAGAPPLAAPPLGTPAASPELSFRSADTKDSGSRKGKGTPPASKAASVLENQRRYVEEVERERNEWKANYEAVREQMRGFETEHVAAVAENNQLGRVHDHLEFMLGDKNALIVHLNQSVLTAERAAKAARAEIVKLKEAAAAAQVAHVQHRTRLAAVRKRLEGPAASELAEALAKLPSVIFEAVDAPPPREPVDDFLNVPFLESRRGSRAPPPPAAGGRERRRSTMGLRRASRRGSVFTSAGHAEAGLEFADRLMMLCGEYGIAVDAAAGLIDAARPHLPGGSAHAVSRASTEDGHSPLVSPRSRAPASPRSTRRSLFSAGPRLQGFPAPDPPPEITMSLPTRVLAADAQPEPSPLRPAALLKTTHATPVPKRVHTSPLGFEAAVTPSRPMDPTLSHEQSVLRAWLRSEEGVATNRSAVVASIAHVKQLRHEHDQESLKRQLAEVQGKVARLGARLGKYARASAQHEQQAMAAHDWPCDSEERQQLLAASELLQNNPDLAFGLSQTARDANATRNTAQKTRRRTNARET